MKRLVVLLFVLTTNASEYCLTKECLLLAYQMKSVMNESADPCDDYFEYACGNYDKSFVDSDIQDTNFEKMKHYFNISQSNKSNEKVALSLLHKCMNDDGSVNIDTFMKDFWDNTDDLTQLIIEITKLNAKSGGIFQNVLRRRQPSEGGGVYIVMSSEKEEEVGNKTYTWDEVASHVKFMNLTEYFYQLLPEDDRTFGVFEDIVRFDYSFLTLDEKVGKSGKALIKEKLYSIWKEILLNNTTPYTPNDYSQCLLKTTDLLPFTSFSIGRITSQENIRMAYMYFDIIVEETREMIRENTWIDENTKMIMLTKLDKMGKTLGFADKFFNQTFVDKMFNRVLRKGIENQSYLSLMRNVMMMKSQEMFFEYSKRDNNTFWGEPEIVTAFYHPSQNWIQVFQSYLQFPYLHKNLPTWSTLVSFCDIAGHEIGHMFDRYGFYENENYETVDVDETTQEVYENKTECLIEKYNKYKQPGFDFNIDGNLTAAENYADQFGVRLAWRLFKKLSYTLPQKLAIDSTIDQQFFQRIAFTACSEDPDMELIEWYKSVNDAHSPYRLRINGVFSNMPEFAQTYKCAKSTKMNSSKKCDII